MDRYRLTKKVAVWGIIINILLLVLKLAVGFAARSQAMIADGFNSAGDIFASFMTYLGNRVSSRPEDTEHPYGHGKAEYIFSMIISFSLLIMAFTVFTVSLNAVLTDGKPVFSWWLIAVAISTIGLKTGLFIYTRKAGSIHENLLILANSEDHRNDVFVTSGTLLGIVLGTRGIYWADAVVGMGISLWIAITGVRIFSSAYAVLMDTSIDNGLKDNIWKTVEGVEGVDHVDSILAKPIGVGYIIIVKVSVQGTMTVNEGHRVSAIVKEKLKMHKHVGDVVVHVNPV